ncbi:MAG: hypothetical protein E5V66_16325 [Mesorhizobium sp.]|nr:MAG: hypothetical protein E5V64_14860 [Mesorhizobium sp.]TIW10869.1 MAG: hypothetical protein E5V66_16325 [Mesorhizobium sp.]
MLRLRLCGDDRRFLYPRRFGKARPGDRLVLLEAMGGGFTWGAVLVRW